jgi:hypothetical protein
MKNNDNHRNSDAKAYKPRNIRFLNHSKPTEVNQKFIAPKNIVGLLVVLQIISLER